MHQYTIRVDRGCERSLVARTLREAGIETGVYYPIPLHKQCHIAAQVGDLRLPVAEQLATDVLSLPIYPQLAEDELEKIVEEVNQL